MSSQETRRVMAPLLEEILEQPLPVLNKGFIRVVDYMGNDDSIVQAARVSYGKGTKTLNDDRALIRYLLRHKHTTPFEMCEIKFHIKAPIFVARQWVRHRTANVNEYSARYSILEEDYYVPQEQQVKAQSSSNKQGRGNKLSPQKAQEIIDTIEDITTKSFEVYQDFLEIENTEGEKVGLAKELARIVLPVNIYTQFYWKIDLHNLLHFLRLRSHEHAQYEIRVYAQAMLDIIKKWVPYTYEAFQDYINGSFELSKKEVELLRELIEGKKDLNFEESGLTKREWNNLKNVFGLKI